ncbi:MAG: polymer-forming cytoskeletal protein [Kiloniellaceae bacterium]
MLLNSSAVLDTLAARGGFARGAGDSAAVPTIIHADLTVLGDLLSDGHILLNGTVEGNINSRTVTVGESGHVEGAILAESVYICGSVRGPVRANTVTVGKTARIVGSIFHNVLTIEPGAFLEGRRPWRPHIDRKLQSTT